MSKKALLVGVNKYKYVQSLRGCVNDVRNMADILTSYYNFSTDEIRTIVDESVTRNKLMQRMDWLIDETKEGDMLLFHFSGHGSQVQDRDGDELDDGMDEILCLHDMDFRNSDSYLVDDDFNNIIDRLPKGVNLTICIDACHSGTATRDIGQLASGLQIPAENMKIQSRFVEPPADISLRNYGKSLKVRRMGSRVKEDKGDSGVAVSAEAKHTLLSGCMDEQTSADAFIGNDYNGAFTYYLCKAIRNVRGSITYQKLIENVQSRLAFNSFSQVPQLGGNKALKNSNFLSTPPLGSSVLTCKYGHPLTCIEGHSAPGHDISDDSDVKDSKTSQSLKVPKRIHITTKFRNRAISRNVLLPSNSEFIGTVRDLTDISQTDEKTKRRDMLGAAYKPDHLDLIENENFRISNVLEFRPDEQRSVGRSGAVKPIPILIKCGPDEEAVILSHEDGVWSWHFNDDCGPSTRGLSCHDNVSNFKVPFKVQDRTTRGLWSKLVCVLKFAKVAITDNIDTAIHNLLRGYEGKIITEGLKFIDSSKGFSEELSKKKSFTDWDKILGKVKNNKKALLFIHGTASSLAGGYADVNTKILQALRKEYPVILGYDHFTLSRTPEDNAKDMRKKLEKSGLLERGVKFDVITHSRGGLVLRSLVELTSGGFKNVDKVIMVACPAGGTNLANPEKWDSVANMINLLTNIFAFTGGVPLKVFFGLVGGLVKFAASRIENPDAIPGIWAMNPDSSFISKLNKEGKSIKNGPVTYNTIGSNFEPSGIFKGGIKDDIADGIADAFFGDRNDLVVDTDNMAVNWPKGVVSDVESNFRYSPDKHVYHLNYFEQAETYRKFEEFFDLDLNATIEECISANQLK